MRKFTFVLVGVGDASYDFNVLATTRAPNLFTENERKLSRIHDSLRSMRSRLRSVTDH